MPKLRDPWKSKVYRWESTFETGFDRRGGILLEPQIRRFVKQVEAEWNLPRSINVVMRRGRNAEAASGRFEIFIGRDSATVGVILHEIAHAILPNAAYFEGHGPEWLGLYVSLLDFYGVRTEAEMAAELTARGLRYRPWAGPARKPGIMTPDKEPVEDLDPLPTTLEGLQARKAEATAERARKRAASRAVRG